MVGVKSQNTQEGGPSDKVTADQVRKRKRGKDTGFVALTPDVVQRHTGGWCKYYNISVTSNTRIQDISPSTRISNFG